MAKQPRVLILGGYGVFGRLLAREALDLIPVQVVIAGRDIRRAAKTCQALRAGDRAEPLALDLNDLTAVRSSITGCFAVICTAGPFQSLNPGLPILAAQAASHWLDISDFSGWVLGLLADRALHESEEWVDWLRARGIKFKGDIG